MTPKNFAIVTIALTVSLTVSWLLGHEIALSQRLDRPCVEDVHSPDSTFTRCDDPRQRLVVPPGWTWFKCECPSEAR